MVFSKIKKMERKSTKKLNLTSQIIRMQHYAKKKNLLFALEYSFHFIIVIKR